MIVKFVFAVSLLFLSAQAKMFQSVTPEKAQLLATTEPKEYCHHCGMYLVKFYKTSHLYGDEYGKMQYCSMHCLVDAHRYDKLKNVRVVDVDSLGFIDAKKAYYVIGSDLRGTMTRTSKYAFADKTAAQNFAKKHGGKVVDFQTALASAKAELPKDNKMLAKKRKAAAKKGALIYAAMCRKKRPPKFHSLYRAKAYVTGSGECAKLDDKKAQAVAVYLVMQSAAHTSAVAVPKEAKCPVCGMFVAPYPKFVAKLAQKGENRYFDGNVDMFLYYFKEDGEAMEVTDYYTLEGIDAKKAYYVAGSNVYGPMGEELISFGSLEDAQTFKADHFAKKIYTFDEIDAALIKGIR